MKISMKLFYQNMAIFFNFLPTSNLLHSLQVKNCDSNSRLVVDEDDYGKFRLKRVNRRITIRNLPHTQGGGPRVVVSTAAFHARVRGSVPGLGGLKETKLFLPHPRVKVSIVGSLRDREVAYSASDRQGSNFESCVWRTVSSQSSHHPQEFLLAQFSLYVHKGGLKPDSFHFPSHSVTFTLPCELLLQFSGSPFNLQGGGGGVLEFLSRTNYLFQPGSAAR